MLAAAGLFATLEQENVVRVGRQGCPDLPGGGQEGVSAAFECSLPDLSEIQNFL